MLARVAEHLYWLSRYVERAETTARLAIAASDTILDLPDGVPYDWESLMQVFGSGDSDPGISEAEVMEQLVLGLDHSGSIRASIAAARENARVTRDLVPKDAWVALNELHGLIERQSFASFDRSSRIRLLKQVISSCRLWHGCLMASQARDLSWLFLRLGDRIEHADMVSRLVDPRVTQMVPGASTRWSSYEAIGWQNLLSALGGVELYRHSARNRMRGSDVLDFVLRDRNFPQSMAAALDRVSRLLRDLPHQRVSSDLIDGIVDGLNKLDLERLTPDLLTQNMDWIQQGLVTLHGHVSSEYFFFESNAR
jgi:uncharacterized alpha-E superfamily protein